MQLDDLDAALGHLVEEVRVVALGVLDPHHVVEEQLVAVAGGEPTVRQAGAHTSTLRSRPTSEWTPYVELTSGEPEVVGDVVSVMGVAFFS